MEQRFRRVQLKASHLEASLLLGLGPRAEWQFTEAGRTMALTDRPRLSASSTTRHPVLPEAPDTAKLRHPIRLNLRTSQQAKGRGQHQTGQNRHDIPNRMSTDQLRQFFAHISRDPSLKELGAAGRECRCCGPDCPGTWVTKSPVMNCFGSPARVPLASASPRFSTPGNITNKAGVNRPDRSRSPRRMRTRKQGWNLPSS